MKKYLILCAAAVAVLIIVFASTRTSQAKDEGATGVNIGDIAPEIALKNQDGNELKLSSLRGKYVILDFWASWCPPCRRANPALVNIYKKYASKKFDNGEGLAIYSVSLDKDKAPWQAAIKADKLEWQDHVCEFLGWRSKVAERFGVESIPANFVLDGNGKILAKDLDAGPLNDFLSKHEKK